MKIQSYIIEIANVDHNNKTRETHTNTKFTKFQILYDTFNTLIWYCDKEFKCEALEENRNPLNGAYAVIK